MEIKVNVEDVLPTDVYKGRAVTHVDFHDADEDLVVVILHVGAFEDPLGFLHGAEITVDRRHVTEVHPFKAETAGALDGYEWTCACGLERGRSVFETMAGQAASDHVGWAIRNNR